VSLSGFIHSLLHVRTKLWRSDNYITTLQFRHPRLLCLFSQRLFRQSCDPVTSLGIYRLCGVVNLSDEFYRDSCLREQLDSHGVLKGQGRAGRASLGVGSPSTLGHPTPTFMPRTSVSPRPRLTGIPQSGSSTITSIPPTSMHHTTSSPSVSSQSNITAATRQPSESQLFNITSYHPQSRTNRLSNTHPPEHGLSQISSETTLPLRFQGEHLEPTPSSDEMLVGMNHEHGPPIQSHFMSSHNDNFENFNTQFPVPVQPRNWSIAKGPEWTETGLVSDTISKMDDCTFLPHFCVYCMSLTSGSFIFQWFLQHLPCFCSIASGSRSRVPI
jgi:hypothetical protein